MDKRRRFFARIWRINAIVILVAGLAGCAVMAMVSAIFLRNELGRRQVSNVVNVEPEVAAQNRTRIGEFSRVNGTVVFRAPLHLEQEYAHRVSSKETTAVQNYLFYDPAVDKSHWLHRGPPVLILGERVLPAGAYANETPLVGVVYELVPKDTSGDNRLTESDARNVAIADPAGKRFTTVLTGISELHTADTIDKNAVLILYTAGGKLRSTLVDLTSHAVLRNSLVAPAP